LGSQRDRPEAQETPARRRSRVGPPGTPPPPRSPTRWQCRLALRSSRRRGWTTTSYHDHRHSKGRRSSIRRQHSSMWRQQSSIWRQRSSIRAHASAATLSSPRILACPLGSTAAGAAAPRHRTSPKPLPQNFHPFLHGRRHELLPRLQPPSIRPLR
jgi:hypothetical protein